MASVASLPRPWLITDKHTFPRLARSTLNDLQQKQHETASFVCVRVQGPSGLALVPCVEYGRPKWPTTMLNHTNIPGTEKCFLFCLFLAPYARTTRYEEAFLPEGKKRPRSLRSLGLASLLPSGTSLCLRLGRYGSQTGVSLP